MIIEIDCAIASGALSINQVLDKNYHRARDINIKHPEASVYEAVKFLANGGAAVEINSQSDDESAIDLSTVLDDVLDDLDW